MIQRKYLILLSLSGMLVAFDQLTKFLVSENFELGESWPLIQNFFHFTLVKNPGAAFGFLSTLGAEWREPFFFVFPSATLGVILIVFHRLSEFQRISIYALSLIVGGAIGNLVDRVRLGYVIDFIDLQWRNRWHFPAFNLADTAITIGVALLLISMFYEKMPAIEET